jgi:hypothetical protein
MEHPLLLDMSKKSEAKKPTAAAVKNYGGLVVGIGELVATARRASARAVNAFMTATYWEIGRRIVEFEQGGADRAKYGEGLLKRLSEDLGKRADGDFHRTTWKRCDNSTGHFRRR